METYDNLKMTCEAFFRELEELQYKERTFGDQKLTVVIYESSDNKIYSTMDGHGYDAWYNARPTCSN